MINRAWNESYLSDPQVRRAMFFLPSKDDTHYRVSLQNKTITRLYGEYSAKSPMETHIVVTETRVNNLIRLKIPCPPDNPHQRAVATLDGHGIRLRFQTRLFDGYAKGDKRKKLRSTDPRLQMLVCSASVPRAEIRCEGGAQGINQIIEIQARAKDNQGLVLNDILSEFRRVAPRGYRVRMASTQLHGKWEMFRQERRQFWKAAAVCYEEQLDTSGKMSWEKELQRREVNNLGKATKMSEENSEPGPSVCEAVERFGEAAAATE